LAIPNVRKFRKFRKYLFIYITQEHKKISKFADLPATSPSTIMKRKRGPAPRGNKRKYKRKTEEEKGQQSDSETADVIDEDEESFHGFSSNDEGEDDAPTVEDEDGAATVAPSDRHTAKKSKKSTPSKEELLDLLLRSSPFQSNLFKLQMVELLAAVRVKYDKMTKLETALHRLKEVIMAIPTSKEQLVEYVITGLTGSCTNLKRK
jgi:hypothetical protein